MLFEVVFFGRTIRLTFCVNRVNFTLDQTESVHFMYHLYVTMSVLNLVTLKYYFV
jgi:hypothetical protein